MGERTAEEWRAVPGFTGCYEISSHGRLRSLDRVVERCGHPMRIRGRVMTPNIGADGYPRASLRAGGGRSRVTIHTLVALAFLGPRPSAHDVRHLNGVKTDCRADNLAYGSRSENMLDAVRHGSIKCGENAQAAKLTDVDVADIRAIYASGGVRQADIASKYGISQSHVSCLIRGRNRS